MSTNNTYNTLSYKQFFSDIYIDPSLNVYPVTLDLEVSNNGPPNNEINSSDPKNKILVGKYWDGDPNSIVTDISCFSTTKISQEIIVGHNIKFDLKYLMDKEGIVLKPYQRVWDTGVFEYIQSGQQIKFPSLEEVAFRHGIVYEKNEEITKLFESGKPFEDIDKELLSTYCEEDVKTTYAIFRLQWEEYKSLPKARQILICIHFYMIKVLTEMESNGLNVDLKEAQQLWINNQNKINDCLKIISDYTDSRLVMKNAKDFGINITSNKTISSIIWGEVPIKFSVRELVGKYKNGKDKYKNVEKQVLPLRLAVWGAAEFSPNLGPPVDDHQLSSVLYNFEKQNVNNVNDRPIEYIKAIKKYRELSKINNTYLSFIFEWSGHTGLSTIHPYYQNTATSTGRLSSAKPNGQNLAPEILSLIKPRHKDWKFICGDFKQLEVCGLAQNSGDGALLFDVNNGVDIHNAIGKMVHGENYTMTNKERRDIKGVVFGTIYGGGANTISEQTGVPKKMVTAIQEAFFARYPTLKQYYYDVRHGYKLNMFPTGGVAPNGRALYKYLRASDTGRMYVVDQDDYGEPSFTQARNYHIQGWSTGDMVPLTVAAIHWFINTFGYDSMFKFVCTKHDDLILETTYSNEVASVPFEEGLALATRFYNDFWCPNNELVVDLKIETKLKETL